MEKLNGCIFFKEDGKLLGKCNGIWHKVSNCIKAELHC